VNPEECLALLAGWTDTEVSTIVRGYRVKTARITEAALRRSTIAGVIVRSLRSSKGDE
jgi:hypothetical protein